MHVPSRGAARACVRAGVCVVWVVAGCGTSGSPQCVDPDRDGFGKGCEQGPDCDDTDPRRTDDCDAVPPADCDANPVQAGCPCLPGSLQSCFPGPADALDRGRCRPGQIRCVNGHWGLCEGAVEPAIEICNGTDRDCDGRVDEGVRSPCGGCDDSCLGAIWGGRHTAFEGTDTTQVTEAGALTLAHRARDATTLWIANGQDDTVSRIDAREARETARYRSGGRLPSRVAVDFNGDAWIVNAAPEGQATVRHIAGGRSRCPDRDGDGTIDTSTGPDDVRDNDECVRLTTDIGEPGATALAVAVDGARGPQGFDGGHPWIGLHDAMEVVRLDPTTGEPLTRVETPGFRPADAAFDPWGTLWLVSRRGRVARIDRRARPLEADVREAPLSCFLLNGLAVDHEGQLVMAGGGCNQVVTYSPRAQRWHVTETQPSPRDVAVRNGRAWVAHAGGTLSRMALDPVEVEATVDLWAAGRRPIDSTGVATDSLGGVWTVSGRTRSGEPGVATRVERSTGEITDHVPVGRLPRVQGDLSGDGLRGPFVSEGTASRVFEGCGAGLSTEWERVHLDVRSGAAGHVDVGVRRAASTDALEDAPFREAGSLPNDASPVELDLREGGVVEVRLTLRTDALDGAPRVSRVGLEWTCPGPG